MNNFQEAINYETIITATRCGDSKVLAYYNKLKSWCDVSESIEKNLQAYKFITGCDEDSLFRANEAVYECFRKLPQDVKIISQNDCDWPVDVKEVPFLYVRGNVDLLKKSSLSIVGTRQPSDSGVELVKKTVDAIGEDFVIVSGLAKGIDGVAHIQALSRDFSTVAVIGTPICSCYPVEHERLQELICQNGLVVSQFAPSRRTQQYFFIQRNLTMSEISGGSIVIESTDGGGAVRQAKYSAQQNKPVFVFKQVYEDESLKWTKDIENIVVIPSVETISETVKAHF